MSGERASGWVRLHRQLMTSALWHSLSSKERNVFITILLSANWKDGRFLVEGEYVPIYRGELAFALETIAERASAFREPITVKVVRNTIAKLLADDTKTGGRGPFLAVRWTGNFAKASPSPEGMAEGTGRRVLTILRYEEFQGDADAEGTPQGTKRAGEGHQDKKGRRATSPSFPTQPDQPPTAAGAAFAAGVGSDGGARSGQGQRVRPQKPTTTARPTTATDPRLQATVEHLERLFTESKGTTYRASVADRKAIGKLLTYPEATGEEITRRTLRATADTYSGHSMTPARLVSTWADWAKPRASSAAKAPAASNAYDEQDNDAWANEPTGVIRDF